MRRLAKACHCGEESASGALHAYAVKMREAAAVGGGDAVEVMRAGATAERRAVADRLARLGALCDDLLAEAEARLCPPLCAVGGLGGVGGASLRPGLPLEDLERLAGILAKAGKLAESSWRLFRSCSGLELAEKLTEAKAREKIKAGEDQGEIWEADFELLDAGASGC